MQYSGRRVWVLTLVVAALWLNGCGGQPEAPRSSQVIAPAAKSAPPAEAAPAESVAATTPTTPPAPSAEAQPPAAPSAPAAEPAPPQTTETASASPGATQPAPAGSAGGAGGTSLTGRVTVKGTAASKTLNPTKDEFCIGLGSIPDDTLQVGADGGVRDVFVYLRKVPAGVTVPPPPSEPVVLDQKDCNFLPHAFLIRVGQTLQVKNDDPVTHNTRMNPLRNPGFNSSIGPGDRKGTEYKYANEELLPVTVVCDIHPWMSAVHYPVSHPWVAITDAEGRFTISDLPPGTHEFRVWHQKVGYIEKGVEIAITAGQVNVRDFAVDAAALTK